MMSDDVLDLDASAPPDRPLYIGSTMIGTRIEKPLAAWVRSQAEIAHTTVGGWLRDLIERERSSEGLPLDVREWLLKQAAQCGCPGDSEQALIEVVRHLARKWPNGGRLHQ